ncbi:NUDIX domain protein [compost metagenome]
MMTDKKLKKKVFGFIIQSNEEGDYSLLVYHCVPGVQFRFVGGNVDSGEELIDALFREIYEESGLNELTLVKKLGVQNYYKEFIDANVERHDYLLVSNKYLPQNWEHKCSGEGGDNGEVFKYQWITSDEIDQIDDEFRNHIKEEYKQDIFEGVNEEGMSIR